MSTQHDGGGAGQPAGAPTMICNARVFDGRRVLEEADSVLLRDGLIAEVGSALTGPSETVVVDAAGGTLLPGLIDAHTHVFPGSLQQALVFGVCTELDMFADPVVIGELKREADRREDMAGVFSAGTGATAPGGHPTQLVRWGVYPEFPTLGGPEEADEFVNGRAGEGSDWLKVILDDGRSRRGSLPTLDAQTVTALAAAAHARGLLVCAHVTDRAAAETALACGVDGLEHLPVDTAPAPDFAARTAAAGVFVTPTLCVLAGMWGDGAEAAALAADPRIAPWLDENSTQMLTAGGHAPPGAPPRPRHERDTVAALHAAGAVILAGTDAANPTTAHGASLHHELVLLVDAGLSPTDALTATTAAPAHAFGLTDRGCVASGRRADLLLVDGDPTTDITATRAIAGIWRSGKPLDRDSRLRQHPSRDS